MSVHKYVTKKGCRYFFKVRKNGRQVMRRGFLKRSEARKAEAVFLLEEDSVVSKVPTLSEVVDSFLEVEKQSLKVSSFYKLKGICVNYILILSDKPISDYSYQELKDWWESIKALGLKISNLILSVMKRVFRHAEVYFSVVNRQAEKLIPLRDDSIHMVDRVKYLSVDSFKKIYSCEKDPFFQLFLLISFFTGCRVSEVRGIQCKCYSKPVLAIVQQVSSKSGLGTWSLTSLKSRSSSRSYVLPGFLAERLEFHISENRLTDESFVFFGRKKDDLNHLEPISENSILRELKRLSRLTGIKINSHLFRHSDATYLSEQGVSSDLIKEYLGHSSESVTKKFYIHSTNERKREIAELFDSKFSDDFK